MGEQDFGRVGDLCEPFVAHFEHAYFVGGAETVLDAAQYPVDVVAVAFELEYDVHDVFQHLGPRYCAVFGDMTDEQDGSPRRFGVFKQHGGALPYLRYAAGRRL